MRLHSLNVSISSTSPPIEKWRQDRESFQEPFQESRFLAADLAESKFVPTITPHCTPRAVDFKYPDCHLLGKIAFFMQKLRKMKNEILFIFAKIVTSFLLKF